MSQSWHRLGPEGAQALLPMARLPLRQMYSHCRAAAGYGGAGRPSKAAGTGGGRGQRTCKSQEGDIK